MDARQVIERDHREVERLLKTLERAQRSSTDGEGAAALEGPTRELVRELSLHAVIEEQFLYPALRELGQPDAVVDALEEHHAVKVLLSELEALPHGSERWRSKYRLIAREVRRHVEEEERELLPRLERGLDEQRRQALGDSLERARRVAPTRPHPEAPEEPPGNFVAGAMSSLLDRSRDALRAGADVVGELVSQGARVSAQAARRLAESARSRSAEAVNGTMERGREMVTEAANATRQAASRVEVRGHEAARTVGEGGRAAADAAERNARKGAARTKARASARARRTSRTPARRKRK
ncbi:MAG: hemerythrin domain-containing protein [Anaeromyxobacteraceae bacterium]